MTGFVRASEIAKLPVVTLGGDDIAQVKDIVFDAAGGSVRCFTLSGRGLLSGPLKRDLLWNKVHALGPDAVMIRDENALADDDEAAKDAKASSGGGNVIGSRVMTEGGTDLGKIIDVIIDDGPETGRGRLRSRIRHPGPPAHPAAGDQTRGHLRRNGPRTGRDRRVHRR